MGNVPREDTFGSVGIADHLIGRLGTLLRVIGHGGGLLTRLIGGLLGGLGRLGGKRASRCHPLVGVFDLRTSALGCFLRLFTRALRVGFNLGGEMLEPGGDVSFCLLPFLLDQLPNVFLGFPGTLINFLLSVTSGLPQPLLAFVGDGIGSVGAVAGILRLLQRLLLRLPRTGDGGLGPPQPRLD